MKSKPNRFFCLSIAPATWLLALGLAHAQGPYTLYWDLNGATAGSGVTNNSDTVWWSALSNANQWAIGDSSGTGTTTNVNATINGTANALSFNNPNQAALTAKSVVFSAANDLSGINYKVRTEGRNFFIQDLTVGSGNLTLEQSGNQIAFGNFANPTITVNNGASLALTSKELNMFGRTVTMDIQGSATASTIGMRGSIAATSALIKNGSGSLSVTGPSTYNGTTTVNGGTLKITDVKGLSFGAGVDHNVVQGAVTVTPGSGMISATLDLNGNATFNKPITLNGTATGGNSAGLINSNVGTTAVLDSGVSRVAFSNRGSGFKLADLTTNPLTLTGSGSGATASINALQTVAGSFSLANGGTGYAVGNDISVNGGGATQTVLYRVTSIGAGGVITGVNHQRTGIGYTSSSGLTFSGGTGTGATFTFNDSFALNAISMTAAGTGYTSAPIVTSSSGASFAGTAAISSLSLTGTNNQIGGDGNLTINSAIGQTATGAGFAKIGSGTLTLSSTSTSTYTGATTVSSGTLVVNGNISTSSLTTVNGSGILSGSGTLGAVTIAAAGTHNPGNSPGIVNTGDYTMAGSLNIEAIGSTPGVGGYDQVNVTGIVNLSGTLNTQFTTGTYANGDMLFFLLNNGADAVTGTFAGLAQDAIVTNYGGFDWKISYTADAAGNTFTGGNDVALMAIPEPSSVALLGTLGAMLLLRRRRA
jgi:autotransporter-associated beta strand protein